MNHLDLIAQTDASHEDLQEIALTISIEGGTFDHNTAMMARESRRVLILLDRYTPHPLERCRNCGDPRGWHRTDFDGRVLCLASSILAVGTEFDPSGRLMDGRERMPYEGMNR